MIDSEGFEVLLHFGQPFGREQSVNFRMRDNLLTMKIPLY